MHNYEINRLGLIRLIGFIGVTVLTKSEDSGRSCLRSGCP